MGCVVGWTVLEESEQYGEPSQLLTHVAEEQGLLPLSAGIPHLSSARCRMEATELGCLLSQMESKGTRSWGGRSMPVPLRLICLRSERKRLGSSPHGSLLSTHPVSQMSSQQVKESA